MKNIFSLFVLLAFVPSISQATEFESIKEIIGSYQQEFRAKFGKEVAFTIEVTSERNAYASFAGPNGSPLITITSAYLDLFDDDEAINSICHEIGHFLGDMSFASVSGRFAIESESDYFGGKCGVKYFRRKGYSLAKAQEITIHNARNSRSKVMSSRLDPNRARIVHFPGIDTDYATGDCRVLSVVHGAMGWKRPSCWYGPVGKTGSK